nr:Zrc1p [Hymenolepis microstoma]
MLAELITGYWCHSLALVADAFHMISDFMALIVGLVATRIAKKPKSSRNTFGWQRAEVMGSLINSVMLIALCFTILINAIERFIFLEEINNPKLMFYVGIGGLVVNILGLIITGGHGHSHGPAPVEGVVEELRQDIVDCEKMEAGVNPTVTPNGNIGSYEAMDSEFLASNVQARRKSDCCSCLSTLQYLRRPSDTDQDHENCHLAPCRNIKPRKVNNETDKKRLSRRRKTRSMNMQAVFLHILADFFGSVIVVTCALVIWLVPGDPQDPHYKWKLYLDPCLR